MIPLLPPDYLGISPAIDTTSADDGSGLGWLLLATLLLLGAALLVRQRPRLRPSGWLPELIDVTSAVLRAMAVGALLAAVARMLPPALAPVLPWLALAAALAVGWSARAFAPDLLAGVLLRVGRRIPPGQWIQVGSHAGAVEDISLLSASLRTPEGTLSLPNRALLELPRRVALPTDAHPVAEAEILLDTTRPAAVVRAALRDAALLSPWTAAGVEPTIAQSALDPRRWTVRVAVLAPHHVAALAGSLHDRVQVALEASS